MKKTIFLLIAALLLTACGVPAANNQNLPALPAQGTELLPLEPPEIVPETPSEPSEEELPPPPDPREETVNRILSAMTLEEKVGQIFFVRCPAADAAEKISQYHLGGVLLFTRDYQNSEGEWLTEAEFLAKIAAFQAAADIPLLIGSDEEGGSVTRASRNPNLFPQRRKSPRKIFADGGMEAVLQETCAYNSRLLELGVNVNFAPVADVSENSSDFIFDRAFGQDAAATAEYIAAVISQMEQCGIGSVLKHFPGYGNNADTHTGVAIDRRPYETFATSDFLPFLSGIEAGAPAVLVSHNIVTSMDADLPASLSAEVHRILREELSFAGVIVTDDLAMDAVAQYVSNGSAAVLALQAGNSMIVTGDFERQIPQVIAAVKQGELSAETIDSAVRYVLYWKYDLGLLQGE